MSVGYFKSYQSAQIEKGATTRIFILQHASTSEKRKFDAKIVTANFPSSAFAAKINFESHLNAHLNANNKITVLFKLDCDIDVFRSICKILRTGKTSKALSNFYLEDCRTVALAMQLDQLGICADKLDIYHFKVSMDNFLFNKYSYDDRLHCNLYMSVHPMEIIDSKLSVFVRFDSKLRWFVTSVYFWKKKLQLSPINLQKADFLYAKLLDAPNLECFRTKENIFKLKAQETQIDRETKKDEKFRLDQYEFENWLMGLWFFDWQMYFVICQQNEKCDKQAIKIVHAEITIKKQFCANE